MTAVVLYFQVHQPYRLRRIEPGEVGRGKDPFDQGFNRDVIRRVARRCYRPANEVLRRLIERTEGRFRASFSLSGTVLQQLEEWEPETLQSFVDLAATGCVEILAETSHHSLSSLEDLDEFRAQVVLQRERVARHFGTTTRTFRNTELILSEPIAAVIEELGFDVVLGEGADELLAWRSPHLVYRPRGCRRLKLLLRSYRYSDDIAFRYSDPSWTERPLTPEKFVRWLGEVDRSHPFVGLYMDYETFGEHQDAGTGIFEFLETWPLLLLESERWSFRTPIELAHQEEPVAELAYERPISWADEERGLGAWLGNPMQRAAHEELYALGRILREARPPAPDALLERFRRLTTSDHVYYMYTRTHRDADVHGYFSHYDFPHQAYVHYLSAVQDLKRELLKHGRRGSARASGRSS